MNKDLPVILYNFDAINLDLNNNDNYIIVTDFDSDVINLNGYILKNLFAGMKDNTNGKIYKKQKPLQS